MAWNRVLRWVIGEDTFYLCGSDGGIKRTKTERIVRDVNDCHYTGYDDCRRVGRALYKALIDV